MIKLNNVKILLDCAEKSYIYRAAKTMDIPVHLIKSIKLYKKSLDVRHKNEPFYCCTFIVEFTDTNTEKEVLNKCKDANEYAEKPYEYLKCAKKPERQPIIIGAGPAGLFAALTLCRAGIPPVIIEQGEPVEQREKDIENFWNGNKLNPHSNVQFGEGGAGTFSDGKLNTGIKDKRCRTVLEIFNEFGADDDILINSKPHIGTDVLRKVIKNMRMEIEKLGGKYIFNTSVFDFVISSDGIKSVLCRDKNGETELPCDNLIIAAGNAARHLFRTMQKNKFELAKKAFAIGARIEHLQESINIGQYGKNYSPLLPPADYKLAVHPSGRGVYTFCMCPGGFVVNSASEDRTYVTNGMSYKARDGKNANSAVLVGVSPEDLPDNPLAGIELQEQIENKAFTMTNGKGVPVQTLDSFLYGGENIITDVLPTVLPGYVASDISPIFPECITFALKTGIKMFDRYIAGFASKSAVLTAPETRSSCPVRIVRNDNFESNINGVMPCGEGAGYAGGITSSAVDGMKCAEQLILKLSK